MIGGSLDAILDWLDRNKPKPPRGSSTQTENGKPNDPPTLWLLIGAGWH